MTAKPTNLWEPPNSDSLGNRQVLVAHAQRHHLYETATAYLEVDRLGAFLTQRYVHQPRRLRVLRAGPLENVANTAERLAGYNSPSLSKHVWVSPARRFEAPFWRLMGARRVIRGARNFSELAGRVSVERNWACHMPCTAALEAFGMCRKEGLPRILEQYIAHRGLGAELIIQEAERWGIRNDSSLLASRGFGSERVERNAVELDLATDTIAGSGFVARSLVERGVDPDRVHTVPYGVDAQRFPPHYKIRKPNEPLRVAFVGSDGLRKGLLYLLRAASHFGEKTVLVQVFGDAGLPEAILRPYKDLVTFHGHVTHGRLLEGLHDCHVGALPSLHEGSAISVYEMLSTGLPAIVTPNTGAIVRDGIDGFVVPIRDTSAIAEALTRLQDEPYRQAMAKTAVQTALRHSWARYRNQLREALRIR